MKPLLLFILPVLMALNACDSNDTPPDCGCESETLSSIPNDDSLFDVIEQQKGLLFYKHPETTDPFLQLEQYNNRFWIIQDLEGCSGCGHTVIICNESMLGSEYDHLKQQGIYDSINVNFSGELKKLCAVFTLPTVYDPLKYTEIVLTSIQQQ